MITGKKALISAYKRARQNGNLNLQNFELEEFPEEICNFLNIKFDDNKWWDTFPLQKLDMTGNYI